MAGKKKVRNEDEAAGDIQVETKKLKVEPEKKLVVKGSDEDDDSGDEESKNGGDSLGDEEASLPISEEEPASEAKSDADNDEVEDETVKSVDAGRLILCGSTNWDLTGRKELPKNVKAPTSGKSLWGPHVWEEKTRIKKAISSCTACHSVLITEDGKAMTLGRNDKGQLGLGDTVTRATPVVVDGLKAHKIIDAACGKGHTLFLTDKGIVYSCGDNTMGQLGIGSQSQNVMNPTKVSYYKALLVNFLNICIQIFFSGIVFGQTDRQAFLWRRFQHVC